MTQSSTPWTIARVFSGVAPDHPKIKTVSRAFVLAPDRGDLKEWAYVTASRARNETRIYLTQTSLENEHEPPAAPNTDGDALERLAAAATRPANERLATDIARMERHVSDDGGARQQL